MRTLATVVFSFLVGSGSLLALVPGVTSVQNPASNIIPGLPNYGIAQGSIFVLYGSQLGPSTIAIAQSLPYQTTLAGTSITVTAGGLTFSPYIIYTLSSQVAAVMPSNVVLGSATIKVTYNGFVGSAFNTTIVQNNFGISTVNQTGNGAAVVTYPTSSAPFYGLVSGANSAVPGNTYTMWGTGLGPAAGGNSDNNVNAFASVGPQPQVLVGGVAASVSYYGRSPGAGPGLDQINFTIPAGVSGCNISLVVQTTATPGTLSNGTTIPISANGGQCSDTFGVQSTTWPPLLTLSNGINLGFIQVSQTASTPYSLTGVAKPTVTSSAVGADFVHYTQAQLASQYQTIFSPNASVGSCVTTVTLAANSGTSTANYTGLDAGSSVNLNSFTGQVFPFGKQAMGIYSYTQTATFPTGAYTLTDGTGGTGVGPIGSIAVTIPAYATWTNQATLGGTQITRANGLTLTWSGGATAGGYIDIQGSAGFGGNGSDTIAFECAASPAAGQFTIPASVLLAMPVGAGSLQLGNNVGQFATIPGMNIAAVGTANVSSIGVNWN